MCTHVRALDKKNIKEKLYSYYIFFNKNVKK